MIKLGIVEGDRELESKLMSKRKKILFISRTMTMPQILVERKKVWLVLPGVRRAETQWNVEKDMAK